MRAPRLSTLLLAGTLALAGCKEKTTNDDCSTLREEITELRGEIDRLNSRIEAIDGSHIQESTTAISATTETSDVTESNYYGLVASVSEEKAKDPAYMRNITRVLSRVDFLTVEQASMADSIKKELVRSISLVDGRHDLYMITYSRTQICGDGRHASCSFAMRNDVSAKTFDTDFNGFVAMLSPMARRSPKYIESLALLYAIGFKLSPDLIAKFPFESMPDVGYAIDPKEALREVPEDMMRNY